MKLHLRVRSNLRWRFSCQYLLFQYVHCETWQIPSGRVGVIDLFSEKVHRGFLYIIFVWFMFFALLHIVSCLARMFLSLIQVAPLLRCQLPLARPPQHGWGRKASMPKTKRHDVHSIAPCSFVCVFPSLLSPYSLDLVILFRHPFLVLFRNVNHMCHMLQSRLEDPLSKGVMQIWSIMYFCL